MTTNELIERIETIPDRNISYTEQQKAIISHKSGPAWVLAGPGSGKTEVLTLLLLRLLFVSNDPIQMDNVPPESIFITTFTRKAAKNLEDRLSYYRNHLIRMDPSLISVDISKLRIGTLQSLCNDLLQEYRYPGYQNVRLMNEFEQSMFIYENSNLIKNNELSFWNSLHFMFSQLDWKNKNYPPNRWARTKAIMKIFNRICNDRVSISEMRNSNKFLEILADSYEEYLANLAANHRSDFSHLQKFFLEFLKQPLGVNFINGLNEYQGIKWILVDEYQDTNLIQETIYLSLAKKSPHNIVVVGDDDQALYRFRGGSVECMITFNEACCSYFGITNNDIQTYPLIDNFRSHEDIVKFCNEYISSFQIMKKSGSRVANKPNLIAKRKIKESYPCLSTLSGKDIQETSTLFADMVSGLIQNNVVRDANQICLLLKSTKETPYNAKPYVDALRERDIQIYNPRNKAFIEQEEIKTLLGCLFSIIDPRLLKLPNQPKEIEEKVREWIKKFKEVSQNSTKISQYVKETQEKISKAELGKYFDATLSEIVFYILGFEPFKTWLKDPIKRLRLGKLTETIENYSSMPVPKFPDYPRGKIRLSTNHKGQISEKWLDNFYFLFIGYITQNGLDDVEDEDIICPNNMVPIMTIHQAKGLEFPFVFVGHINSKPDISDSHVLEDVLGEYPENPSRRFNRISRQERAELDLIRLFYVAYSRPEFALIIMGRKNQFKKNEIPCGPTKNWLQQRTINL